MKNRISVILEEMKKKGKRKKKENWQLKAINYYQTFHNERKFNVFLLLKIINLLNITYQQNK